MTVPAGSPALRASARPRLRLGAYPTPVVRAERLEHALGCGPLLVKRDDLAGFGVAGNKTRPLEFLLGEAVTRGVEVVVTGGGPGSNFCPAAAMAARAAGMECELVVWGYEPGASLPPNLALAAAAGAVLRPTGSADRAAVDRLAAGRAAELEASGRRALALPRGGSTPLGAVGFALAAAELAEQLDPLPGQVVLAVGSGGSCAGLLAGFAAVGVRVDVVGVSVSRPPEEIGPRVLALAAQCAELLGGPTPRGERFTLVDARGAGFGTASDRERELAVLAFATEGLLVDHTYGAQALAVAVDEARAGPGDPLLLWHTGGLVPALAALGASGARKEDH